MSIKLFVFAAIIIGFCSCQGLFDGFDYSNQGNDWGADYSDCNKTIAFNIINQSPLNLTPSETTAFGYYFYFMPQYTSGEATVKQYNITVEFNATNEFGKVYTLTAGKQIGIYQATSLRIHSEAEHLINNTRYPVELQIYHKLIDTRQDASKYQYNLFVSVFFDNSTDNTPSELLGNITQAITNNASSATIDLSTLFDLTAVRDEVYSYGGVQTIPPCAPASWFVFPKVFSASADQIQTIYNLYHNNPNFLGNGNYRDVQPNTTVLKYYLFNADAPSVISTDL